MDFVNGLGFGLNKEKVYEFYFIGGFGDDNLGVFLLIMVGVYSVFGNNGMYNELYFVKFIEFNDGIKFDLILKLKLVMSDYIVFMIIDMLKIVVKIGIG